MAIRLSMVRVFVFFCFDNEAKIDSAATWFFFRSRISLCDLL